MSEYSAFNIPIPPQRRDSLSRATRDLMALEGISSSKRPSTSHHHSSSNIRTQNGNPMPVASGSSSRPPPTPSTSNMKPTLSASQKKANHIQSEQKRRANIRRGYEALCEVVPTLREALAQPTATEPRKRRRTNGANEEKVAQADGRAGPKSENVVLAKTIDHIHALLAETEALRARLAAVDSPNRDPNELRLWERKWDGGHKRGSDDEDDGDSDE